MRLYADSIAPVSRNSDDELFFIRMVAEPLSDSPEAAESGGAFVNCWVDADDLREAEQITVDAIHQERWRPVKFEQWQLVRREDFSEHDESEDTVAMRECFEAAIRDGFTFSFYCWPLDAPDAADEQA